MFFPVYHSLIEKLEEKSAKVFKIHYLPIRNTHNSSFLQATVGNYVNRLHKAILTHYYH